MTSSSKRGRGTLVAASGTSIGMPRKLEPAVEVRSAGVSEDSTASSSSGGPTNWRSVSFTFWSLADAELSCGTGDCSPDIPV
jgi:hypothetical protein